MSEARIDAPYPGLRPFEQREAEFFYGRGAHLGEMLKILHEEHGLAVVGSSGCGKSSLVKAGLLPTLEKGLLGAPNSQWRCIVARPGSEPYKALATEIIRKLDTPDVELPNSESVAFCEQTLRAGPLALFDAIADTLPADNVHVFVLIDQFEELFRFAHRDQSHSDETHNDALAFVDMLVASAKQRHPRVYVAITMRSDFLGECDAFRGLPEWITRCQFLPPRLTREELQDAISRPPQHARFQSSTDADVVSELITAMGDRPDQLPLIQHALLRMWKLAEEASEALHQTKVAIIAPRDEPSSQRLQPQTTIATGSNSNLEGTSRGAMTATLVEPKHDSTLTSLEVSESNEALSQTDVRAEIRQLADLPNVTANHPGADAPRLTGALELDASFSPRPGTPGRGPGVRGSLPAPQISHDQSASPVRSSSNWMESRTPSTSTRTNSSTTCQSSPVSPTLSS